MSFRTWLEAEAVDFTQYDLQARYDHFNALLFNGELPKIPLEWANLKTVGGQVRCKVKKDPSLPPMLRLRREDKYKGYKIVDGSHYMQISKLFKKSAQGLDAIMVHEMIHVYFNHIGEFGEDHGVRFLRMARELSQKVGFEIPLTDNIEKMGLTDESKLKTVGVQVVYRKDGSVSIAMMSDKNLTAGLPDLLKRWEGMVPYYAIRTEFYVVNSVKWTELANTYPLQRRKAMDLSYYTLRATDALEDLKQNGKLVGSVPNGSQPTDTAESQ